MSYSVILSNYVYKGIYNSPLIHTVSVDKVLSRLHTVFIDHDGRNTYAPYVHLI
jgi:hypothetical protein